MRLLSIIKLCPLRLNQTGHSLIATDAFAEALWEINEEVRKEGEVQVKR